MSEWHSKSTGAVLAQLEVLPGAGLSEAEAAARLERYGKNELDAQKGKGLFLRVLAQFRDPMILVLLAAAVLSLLSSGFEDFIDPIIILMIVLVNAVISISQEDSAEKALDALRKMTAPLAKVLRGGQMVSVEAALLVPGDILTLEAGDLVPADARILTCVALKTDESAMTGESLPAHKHTTPLPRDTALGDRGNMVISATVVTAGRATCVVTGTGMDTEVGRIAGMLLGAQESETPLQRKLAEISKVLSFLCLSVCAVMFGIGLLQHKELLDMFMTAVSLAVAAIPEGLPAIVTIVLAMGVQRMVKRGAIVKTLPAVETLGCASVICSDKTGTLTQNKMTVVETWSPHGADIRTALTIGALCNDARVTAQNGSVAATGDPTEAALVAYALDQGLNQFELARRTPRVADIPFESERKMMTTIHPHAGGYRVMVKGAPDVLLRACTRALRRDGDGPITAATSAAITRAAEDMAGRALRVLGMAYQDIDHLPDRLTPQVVERNLTFAGLMGMIDPPRPEVRGAVKQCFAAGIRPVMITGDHKLTALAIAKQLGIHRPGDAAITGDELNFMPQELLEADIARFSVFARVSPEHKMRIVKAWQKKGHIVAMTGDGVNDAPALKAADIGCAMGIAGTDVAKGAADMILTDDNFATIVHAVEQGRGIYANIKKAVHYLLSSNIGEIITIFTATVFGFHQMPLIPVQLLWLNLVTDSFPALALGVEPVEPGIMQQAPRDARKSLFAGGFALRLAWQGIMVGCITLAAYLLGEYVLSDPMTADGVANTMAFATLTMQQLFHAFDVRSDRLSVFKIGVLSNPAMNRAFLLGMAMQLSVLLVPPLMRVFSVTAMNPVQWAFVLGLSILPVVVCEVEKALRRLSSRRR